MIPFDREKFNQEFLQSDGWKVSHVYISFSDRYMRRDAQDAYEGAKWAWDEAQRVLSEASKTQSEEDCHDFLLVSAEDLRDGSICAGDDRTEKLSVTLNGQPVKNAVIVNVENGFIVGYGLHINHSQGEIIHQISFGEVVVKAEGE